MRKYDQFITIIFVLLFSLNISALKNIGNKKVIFNDPIPLDQVKYWAYQLQDVNTPGTVDSLVASHYDMLVLEPTRTDWSSDDKYFNTSEMVKQLKNSFAHDRVHRKLVIAYIDIGEAEDWRWYWNWSTDWNCEPPLPQDWPQYIIACDPDGWSGNYPVAYWDPVWQDLTIWGNNQNSLPFGNYKSIIDETIIDGFDGIYLDWVEAFEDISVKAAAETAGKNPAVEMINFIQYMRDYASIRNPNFIIIQQNAASLIEGHPELLDIIDAISQEAIWYDGDADVDWNNLDGYDYVNESDLVDYYLDYLDQYLDGGVLVFNCEYALNYAESAYIKSYAKGYIPYVSRRSLSQLTTTTPPEYGTTVEVSEEYEDFFPNTIQLHQNYPNPFNPSTVISYTLPSSVKGETANVKIIVYDVLGREVATLVNKEQSAGNYQVTFDASNLTSGIYFYRIQAGNFVETKKMIFMK